MSTSMSSHLLKPFGSAILGSGPRARLSILIYHRVLPEPDPMLVDEIDASVFSVHMDALAAGFNVLPLSEAVSRLQAGSLPPRAACVTFDDGYANNESVALPILRSRSIPASFFVATGFTDGDCMWNDIVIEALRNTAKSSVDLAHGGLGSFPLGDLSERRNAMNQILPAMKKLNPEARSDAIAALLDATGARKARGMMMSTDQLRNMANAGMEIGGHTVNHPILATLDRKRAREEMGACKEQLEGIIGQAVSSFAYPNGRPGIDFTDEHVSIARELGYRVAVTTRRGTSSADSDPLMLSRFTPWDQTAGRFTMRLYQNALQNLNADQ